MSFLFFVVAVVFFSFVLGTKTEIKEKEKKEGSARLLAKVEINRLWIIDYSSEGD